MSAVVAGFAEERFAGVRAQFQANFDSGQDVGASVCITENGKTVVDLWGGLADDATGKPWARDTIVNVYSLTKTMTALTALLVADRGELDFSAPVSKYWPEFAANGKKDIKVSHLMSHASGLSGWKEKMTTEDLYDWDKATSLLAAQAPFWEPGSKPGYHAITQGYLVGEVIRRITGRSVGTVFREEIAEPLGADFHIGLPASEDDRVAVLIPPPKSSSPTAAPPSELVTNMATNPAVDNISATRSRAWRGAEIPAAGGTGNARSVAEVHTILANGGVGRNGKRFISEAGVRKALEVQIEGQDMILGTPVKYGMGFGLPAHIPVPSKNTIFWGGYGSHLVLIDMDRHTTIAYTMTKMAPSTVGDMRAFSLAMAFWGASGAI
jgi:CubicO group peptidase (beta-lactamase class C family)